MKPAEKKLLKYFSRLSAEQRTTLLQFAEFLAERKSSDYSQAEAIPPPVIHERPMEESVVGAIKRLSASYPMLDRDKLFNATSTLMTRHVMQGEEATIIIDELEQLFQKNYQQLVNENKNPDSESNN